MGPNAVANPAALVAALKQAQPPQKPGTPFERLNPDQQALEHIKSAAVSLERATQFTNDQPMLMVWNAMIGTLNKALLKFDGTAVMASLQESVQSFPPTGAPGPMGGQPPPGPPGLGAPAVPQAPPMGGPQPPMPGAA
jgi:hypothetical protein